MTNVDRAVALIDAALVVGSDRTLLSSTDTSDLLLDIRQLLTEPT